MTFGNGIQLTNDTLEYWCYGNTRYATLADADAAAVAMKNTLDNQPTTYINVREVTGSAESGWRWATSANLTDSEIVNLSGDGIYYSQSEWDSEALYGQTVQQVKDRVLKCRNLFGYSRRVDIIFHRVNASGDWKTINQTHIDPSVDLTTYLPRNVRYQAQISG